MPFEGSFRPLIEAVGGIGSLPSTPAAFLEIGFDDYDFLELQRAVTPKESARSLHSNFRPFWYCPVPDMSLPFQDPFQFICLFQVYRTLVIPHNFIICWFSKASTTFLGPSELVTQNYLRPPEISYGRKITTQSMRSYALTNKQWLSWDPFWATYGYLAFLNLFQLSYLGLQTGCGTEADIPFYSGPDLEFSNTGHLLERGANLRNAK